jgi:catechol 2,3-dioxygenase-like lactoylglutathione lyase family enzyme
VTIVALNHVSVTVGDMDEALAFWGDGLGLELIGRGTVQHAHLDAIVGLPATVIEWAELRVPGGGLIELFRYHRPRGQDGRPPLAPNDRGATHVAFTVADLDALLARLLVAGHPARSAGPVEIPTGDWSGWRDVYVESPDGVIVELSEPPAGQRA